jgi:hypothetical protein
MEARNDSFKHAASPAHVRGWLGRRSCYPGARRIGQLEGHEPAYGGPFDKVHTWARGSHRPRRIPPNQKLDWHWHPGEEFHYYLEGNPVIERVDAPPIIGKPGTVGHVAFKQRHRATAGDEGATILVFRVHTKGEPWRFLDEKEGRKGKSE